MLKNECDWQIWQKIFMNKKHHEVLAWMKDLYRYMQCIARSQKIGIYDLISIFAKKKDLWSDLILNPIYKTLIHLNPCLKMGSTIWSRSLKKKIKPHYSKDPTFCGDQDGIIDPFFWDCAMHWCIVSKMYYSILIFLWLWLISKYSKKFLKFPCWRIVGSYNLKDPISIIIKMKKIVHKFPRIWNS